MREFENKVAIVTGAGSGIGKAIALSLAEQGARVFATDIDEMAAQRVVSQIEELRPWSMTSHHPKRQRRWSGWRRRSSARSISRSTTPASAAI